MGFNLQPQEIFTIVRHLPDPNDATTLYVRAIIRNSRTGATIDTVNLTESGANTHRFTADWNVIADVSGLGTYIDITTYVYTDSGYTTKSTVYGEDNNTYLVFDRFKRIGGGGGGEVVNYKKIGKMLSGLAETILGSQKDVNLSPVLDGLSDVKMAVSKIDIPQPEKVYLSPVVSAVKSAEKGILEGIRAKEVTPETDMAPVLNSLSRMELSMKEHHKSQSEELRDAVSGLNDTHEKFKKTFSETALPAFQELHDKFSKTLSADYPEISKNLDTLIAQMKEAFLLTSYNKSLNSHNPVKERVTSLVGEK